MLFLFHHFTPNEVRKKIEHTNKIIKLIISKGGLYADIAKLYINNNEKSVLFILECSKQCHAAIAQLYWGNDLIHQIERYSKMYHN